MVCGEASQMPRD